MRILFVGGLSAGHLSPLLAVREEVMHKGAMDCLFVCSKRETDAAFLRKNGVDFVQITHPTRSLSAPFQFWKGLNEAKSIISDFEPDVVFSKGGAVSLPLCLAAWMCKIPIVLHESDTVMGLSNRLISKMATVCSGFGSPGTINTGNPIRHMVTQGKKEEGLKIAGFDGTRPILLVMGGSQGAQALNDAVTKNLDALLETCDVIHLTGEGKGSVIQKKGYFTLAFAHQELPHLYACTTLALSRAGAGSMSELAAWSIPTILVPIEGLAQNHQVRNAEEAKKQGACVVLPQNTLLQDVVATVRELSQDKAKQSQMGSALNRMLVSDAARLVSEVLFKVISTPQRNK